MSVATAGAEQSQVGDDFISSTTNSTVNNFLTPIAAHLAGGKLSRNIHKLLSKAVKQKCVVKGTKSVLRSIRKSTKGIVLIAANNSVLDSIIHLPVICEENQTPYCFVRTAEEISVAMGESQKNLCVMVNHHDDHDKAFQKCLKKINKMS